MEKKNGVKHSMQSKVQSRRRGVIERLEKQLKTGTKTVNEIVTSNGVQRNTPVEVELTEHDRNRIKKEIETLKTRI